MRMAQRLKHARIKSEMGGNSCGLQNKMDNCHGIEDRPMNAQAGHRIAALARVRPWGMWTTIILLLLLPMVAMQFTREVQWDKSDFAAAALLLCGGGLAYEIGSRLLRATTHRLLLGALLLLTVGLIWAEGAVGIF
jgi:hypothetical protein